MTKPVLYITRRLPAAIEARANRDYQVRQNPNDVPVTPADILRNADGADAVICCPAEKLDAATIAALPASVKAIATYSVGFDHVDVQAARARNIPVGNTPEVLSVATAEIALLLILVAARRAGEGERIVRAGQWSGWAPTQLVGTHVAGKKLGIFGLGRIGRELMKLVRGFDMEIHYRDQQKLPDDLAQGATFHDNDDSFLANCELLSLHAPGGDGTRKWLNAERIAKLPKGAVVVNTSRGTSVDDEALIAALRSGHLAAAGLDVYDGEPKLNPGYLDLENVVLLPHLGSANAQTRDAMGNRALDNIDAALAGKPMPYPAG